MFLSIDPIWNKNNSIPLGKACQNPVCKAFVIFFGLGEMGSDGKDSYSYSASTTIAIK